MSAALAAPPRAVPTDPGVTCFAPPKGNATRYASALFSMIRSRLVTHRPFFLAHAATFGCNSRCRTCSYWKLTPRMREDASTEEVFALLDEAYDLGMRGYYLFGGEPLVRRDVGALVDYAHRKGFLTTVNTNGALLAPKADQLVGLDFAFVSVDAPDARNDAIRGRRDSLNEVLRGIARLRERTGAKVTLVTTISTLNFDAIEPMAALAQELDVSISFNSVEPTLDFGLTDDRASPNFELGLTPARLHEFYERLLAIKRAGYPLLETERVLEDFVEGRPWTCHFPKMFLYVSPDRKVYSCDYRYGYDLKTGSLRDYLSSAAFGAHVTDAEACNRCVRTCVRGYSYAYGLRPRDLVALGKEGVSLFHQVHGAESSRKVAAVRGAVAPRPGDGPPCPGSRGTPSVPAPGVP